MSNSKKIWSCKIGEVDDVAQGADWPMRQAVSEAYQKLVGREPNFLFSGWGATLDECERAVVENRPPRQAAQATPPADMVSVPVVPTPKMIEAGVMAHYNSMYVEQVVADVYRAMIGSAK